MPRPASDFQKDICEPHITRRILFARLQFGPNFSPAVFNNSVESSSS
jgi:hypothetical protein